MKYLKSNHILKFIIWMSLILAIVYLALLSGVSIRTDEPFTMSLINNSYKNVVNIDALDVHPPLYYLVLKLFLQITTFYTKSVYVKIIFSRIFTILTFLISFYFLYKIIHDLFHINIAWYSLLLGYILMPSIIINITQIRMYEFASMFLVLELYELIKFNLNHDRYNLFIAIVFAAFTSYIHYFAAVSAGLMLLVFLIKYLYQKNWLNVKRLFCSGILFLVFSSIAIRFSYSQVMFVLQNQADTSRLHLQLLAIVKVFVAILAGKSTGVEKISALLICLVFVIITMIFIFNSVHNHMLNNRLCSVLLESFSALLLTFFVLLFMAFVDPSLFQARYTYPIFSLYYFFLIAAVIYVLKKNSYHNLRFLLIISLIFVDLVTLQSSINVHKSNAQSINIRNARNVNINCNHNGNVTDLMVQHSVYLQRYKNRKIIAKHVNVPSILGDNNTKLFHKVFKNIYVK